MNASIRGQHRGFTLIETLALATLLGLAATVVVPRIGNHSERAKREVVKHHVAQLNQLAERHFVDVGMWPNDLPELVSDGYLDAVPSHPDESTTYRLNRATHRVEEASGD